MNSEEGYGTTMRELKREVFFLFFPFTVFFYVFFSINQRYGPQNWKKKGKHKGKENF